MGERPKTWGDVYRRWLRKGHDHGSAAYEASKWEERRRGAGVSFRPSVSGKDTDIQWNQRAAQRREVG